MLNIIQRLDRERFDPTVAVLRRGGKLDAEVEKMGLILIEAAFMLSAKPYFTLLSRARHAAQAFRPQNFALWHSFHYSADYTEPLIARFAGARRWLYTKKNMNWGSRAWHMRSLLASAIPCQNEDMLERFFGSALYTRKAIKIPPGVDTSIFHPAVGPTLNMRSRLGMREGEVAITCVAEMVPVKGHPTLLGAITRLPSAHLYLAGRFSDQVYTQALVEQADKLGITHRAHFLGRVEDIPALLAESDIFVLPTIRRGEGCPVAVLEAMACAKACVVTNVPGSRDVISNGENGLIVEPEDPQSLANALQRLTDDANLRLRLGQAALEHIRAHYTIDREVAEYSRLYEQLARM